MEDLEEEDKVIFYKFKNIIRQKMRKTIFGFMFAMILGAVMTSCTGNGTTATEVTAADSTLVDTTLVVTDTLVADTLGQAVVVTDSVE